ncbi:unnamed protein product [Brachionus calyciflorus]|uniref:pyridoxal 5'-phosphate synthase n=1 Tax=Brachionus calyciflorus TaxID=104777 RepID=A0A813V0J3_9BILA|nr:unnamed protein product [Brachionus calyciflorus]
MPGTKYTLDVSNLHSRNPFKQFDRWLQEAKNDKDIKNPSVMCLTTCSPDCKPSCRMIQLQDFNEKGLLFSTHYESKKAKELNLNPKCSVCFYWDDLDRQVVMNGRVEKISEVDYYSYFSRKPIEEQIKIVVSEQGKILPDKQPMIEKQKKLMKQFEETKQVPLPETWCGYLFIPEEFDFWQGNSDDLDDRLRFRLKRDHENTDLVVQGEGFWVIERLSA